MIGLTGNAKCASQATFNVRSRKNRLNVIKNYAGDLCILASAVSIAALVLHLVALSRGY